MSNLKMMVLENVAFENGLDTIEEALEWCENNNLDIDEAIIELKANW